MDILPFTSTQATLEIAGGKGSNLARLTRAGFPVPPGFIIPTGAYRLFVAANHLSEVIAACLSGLSAGDAARLDRASTQIRAAFSEGSIHPGTETTIRNAYRELNQGPVAVRSSATTEDLPDLSFAGQQDTYLNVSGEDALLEAVVNCWSSLWTARAIGYRLRNEIAHEEAALAVVVQEMVPSEVSGVLFTANPLTGLRTESVIDAAWGLGDVLVSGKVEPDHFVVDSIRGEVTAQTLAAGKAPSSDGAGGAASAAPRPTLSADQIRQLADLGLRVQEEYRFPQDIEWAYSKGRLYILQARPITSLFPIPEFSLDPLSIWFSFGAAQGMLEPMTPLGRDAIRSLFAGAGTVFGLRLKPEELKLVRCAGERLWIDLSGLVRHPIGYRLAARFMEFIEPGIGRIVHSLAADPRTQAGSGRLKVSTVWRVGRLLAPVLPRILYNLLRPEKARLAFDDMIEARLASARITPAPDRFSRLANIVDFQRERIAGVFSFLLPYFVPVFAASMAGLSLLFKISGQERSLALQVTRGLPDNVTTEMDLSLWNAALAIKADPDSAAVLQALAAPDLARRYLNETLPPAAQATVRTFMEKYGMRGVGEVDMGRRRWREDPTPVMNTLQSYLRIEGDSAPDAVFARGAGAAQAAVETLAARARRQPLGRLKASLVRLAARRVRILMGARESPKFYAVRNMGIAREALLAVGVEFAAAGTLDRPGDLVFLRLSELESLAHRENRDWKALIAERRLAYRREQRRRQVPRVLVSDGRAFYEGLGAETGAGDVITGSPVSPGVVEGVVHVILDPDGAQLAPGEILVCPGTDPAWTPLFLAAGGLITEVGGMMTHGSVVAREYGIPAVVGVHHATTRLKDGQTVRVDGTQGKIVVLEQ